MVIVVLRWTIRFTQEVASQVALSKRPPPLIFSELTLTVSLICAITTTFPSSQPYELATP